MGEHGDVLYQPIEELSPVSGEACLDLANTTTNRVTGPRRERLREYGDLVKWGELTGTLDARGARALRRRASASPRAAAASLGRALALREAIYGVLHAGARGLASPAAAVPRISELAAQAAAAQQLVLRDGVFALEWPATDELDRAWWPAATSARSLLLSDQLERVKECDADNCNWLFIDLSKNRSRRWCDMSDCGNRAKAKRHYERSREASQ